MKYKTNREYHGESHTKLYKKWKSMIYRCQPSWKNSEDYYERGITVCDEWKNSYLTFKAWALGSGYEEGLDIDRKDNDGNYEPSNCRFVTRKINSANRRNTLYVVVEGNSVALTIHLEKIGRHSDYNVISNRIVRGGYSLDEALSKPIRNKEDRIGICQKDLHDIVIAKFNNYKEASLHTGYSTSGIINAANGNKPTLGGFKWEYICKS